MTAPQPARIADHAREVHAGQRFEFGKNWQAFLHTLDEPRILRAQRSLCELLDPGRLKDHTFLDIGSGSGLSSLCARRLGARVHSLDYDPQSVACTRELRRRYFENDPNWLVEEASVLDPGHMRSLGEFDVVYSWGVLHHTGKLWEALANAADRVKPGGLLFIAIYNDQGRSSKLWRRVKKTYCSNRLGKAGVCAVCIPYFAGRMAASSLLRRRNMFAQYQRLRGMSVTHDWFDWLGGYPFEVASVEDLHTFLRARAFTLRDLRTVNNLANNQLLFERDL